MVSALYSGLRCPRAQPLARVITICQLSYMPTDALDELTRPSSISAYLVHVIRVFLINAIC